MSGIPSSPYVRLNSEPDSAVDPKPKETKNKNGLKRAEQVPVQKTGQQVGDNLRDSKKSGASSEDPPSEAYSKWIAVPDKSQLKLTAGWKALKDSELPDRISAAFGLFVNKACPKISHEKYTEALDLLAFLSPPKAYASDKDIEQQISAFLPDEVTLSKDGLKTSDARVTSEKRADHLIKVLNLCVQNRNFNVVDANELVGSGGQNQVPESARENWNFHLPRS